MYVVHDCTSFAHNVRILCWTCTWTKITCDALPALGVRMTSFSCRDAGKVDSTSIALQICAFHNTGVHVMTSEWMFLFECDKLKAYILQTRNWLPSSCLAEHVTTLTGRQVRLYKSINWWFTGTDAARQQSLNPHANYSHSEKAVIQWRSIQEKRSRPLSNPSLQPRI